MQISHPTPDILILKLQGRAWESVFFKNINDDLSSRRSCFSTHSLIHFFIHLFDRVFKKLALCQASTLAFQDRKGFQAKVWSPGHGHQHKEHLKTCQKCKLLVPIPDLLNQKLQKQGPSICISTRSPANPDTCSSLRTFMLRKAQLRIRLAQYDSLPLEDLKKKM